MRNNDHILEILKVFYPDTTEKTRLNLQFIKKKKVDKKQYNSEERLLGVYAKSIENKKEFLLELNEKDFALLYAIAKNPKLTLKEKRKELFNFIKANNKKRKYIKKILSVFLPAEEEVTKLFPSPIKNTPGEENDNKQYDNKKEFDRVIAASIKRENDILEKLNEDHLTVLYVWATDPESTLENKRSILSNFFKNYSLAKKVRSKMDKERQEVSDKSLKIENDDDVFVSASSYESDSTVNEDSSVLTSICKEENLIHLVANNTLATKDEKQDKAIVTKVKKKTLGFWRRNLEFFSNPFKRRKLDPTAVADVTAMDDSLEEDIKPTVEKTRPHIVPLIAIETESLQSEKRFSFNGGDIVSGGSVDSYELTRDKTNPQQKSGNQSDDEFFNSLEEGIKTFYEKIFCEFDEIKSSSTQSKGATAIVRAKKEKKKSKRRKKGPNSS